MRRLAVPFALLLTLLLAACGGSGEDAPRKPVFLKLTGPADGAIVRENEIELKGLATRGADVTVAGKRAAVTGGVFSATVPLDAGGNVIDVMASADGRAPVMTALRVVRQLTVRIPDVGGDSPSDARDRLAASGLRVTVHEAGGLIDELLPVDRIVCGTDPGAGSTVDSGSTVDMTVSKVC
jgi:hypothetical protein